MITRRSIPRRSILKGLLGTALGLPLASLAGRRAIAGQFAKRLIVFYFPDGVPAPGGEPSRFHATGSGSAITLPENLQPLAPFKNDCVFLRGLSMGPTDAGSHPGGAKKLLTGVDGGQGESIDRYLARTAGSASPYKHVYLGSMATQNNATGDKFVSYPSAGTTVAPNDDPKAAFANLFGQGGGAMTPAGVDPKTVVDTALADLDELRARLGDAEKAKLDLHVDAMHDVEKRLAAQPPPASCNAAPASLAKVGPQLQEPGNFPNVLRAQTDVLVQAMACGLTQVGVLQASEHTSELIMSRFSSTPLYDPNYDMRSHQASHYGVSSDPKFAYYVKQRTWFVEQFAYLLDQLRQRPEGQGTMLDSSIVLLCTEVSDGNTHSHDDMPFILAGKAGGALKTGQVLDFGGRRHSDLLVTIARAMGDPLGSFGQASSGPLPGVLA